MQNRLKIAISVTGFIEWTGGINFLKGIIDLLLNNDNDFYLLLPSFSLKNYPKFLVKNFKSLLKLYNQIFPAKENRVLSAAADRQPLFYSKKLFIHLFGGVFR